jgi:hypothetical protein
MEKGKKNKVLPAILMAGAMTVPSAAMARELARELQVTADQASTRSMVTDSQAAWEDASVDSIHLPQWAEVTWGEVVWARGPFHQDP